MTDKRLTENEARQFLALLDQVEDDLDQAFTNASEAVFGERDENESESIDIKWGAPASEVYVEQTRYKLRQFVEHAYLHDDSDEWDIKIADDAEEGVAAAAEELGLGSETQEALDAFTSLLAENADAGKPMLQPPLHSEEIETIDDERLRALAWDLDAIATAYNYASDPTIPDLAREDRDTWIEPTEEIRLEQACSLLQEGYESIYHRVGDELEQYKKRD